MATRQQLQELAQLRLEEAEALFKAGLYDGCVYLCGYVVELALKARICAVLSMNEYSGKGSDRLRKAFQTHDFDDLKLLAGMERVFSADSPELLANWSIASKWKPDWRCDVKGTYDKDTAKEILKAIGEPHNGVLKCISQGW